MTLQHSGQHKHYKLTGKASIPAAIALAGLISTYVETLIQTLADGALPQVTRVTFVADVSGSLNNTYFLMASPTVDYYIWYNVNSAGVDPAPGGTGFVVNIPTGATAIQVAAATNTMLNIGVGTGIFAANAFSTTISDFQNRKAGVAHSVSGAGTSGFTVATTTVGVNSALSGKDLYTTVGGTNYYIWYNVTGLGTASVDPAPVGKTAIPVTIAAGDTNATVATNTRAALNAFGTGIIFYATGATNQIKLQGKASGNGISVTDGAVATGFTITESNNNKSIVYGDGTDFTQIQEGDYLYDATNCEVRRVASNYTQPPIAGNTRQRIDLYTPFTNNQVNATLYYVPNKTIFKLDLINEDDSATAKIDGIDFLAGQVKKYKNDGGLVPIAVDATGTSVDIEYWNS